MLITLKRSLVLAAACAGLTGTPAYAADTVTARIPFDFTVNGQQFPAGRYQVEMNAATGTADVVSVRGQDGRSFAFVMTTPANGHDPQGAEPALVFKRHENSYVLSQIWESDLTGREVPRT